MTTDTLEAPAKPKRTKRAAQFMIERLDTTTTGDWIYVDIVKSLPAADALLSVADAGEYRAVLVRGRWTVKAPEGPPKMVVQKKA